MRQNREKDDDLNFVVRICNDVLLVALSLGDRRGLTKLELVGRRFHRIIENFLQQRPFLRFCTEINPLYQIYFSLKKRMNGKLNSNWAQTNKFLFKQRNLHNWPFIWAKGIFHWTGTNNTSALCSFCQCPTLVQIWPRGKAHRRPVWLHWTAIAST